MKTCECLFDVPLSTVRELLARHAAGEALTFQDGLTVAYAIGERLLDDLEQVAAGEEADVPAVAVEIQELTDAAYAHAGVRERVRAETAPSTKPTRTS